MLTAGPRDQFSIWRRSRRRFSVCSVLRCPDWSIQCRREFCAQFKKDTTHKNNILFKPCTKLTLRCNHRSRHLKTEHTGSLLLQRRHLGNWPRSKHEKRTAERIRNAGCSRCWQCMLRPCKMRNKFFINFWNRTILLCITSISSINVYFANTWSYGAHGTFNSLSSGIIKMKHGAPFTVENWRKWSFTRVPFTSR
jgi:hypothetical protein